MAEQLKIVSLKCINCGGVLEIHGDMEQFACGYCGSGQIVQRRGGTVALKPIADAVARVQVGTDKTAAELALVRLNQELAQAQTRLHQVDVDFRKWQIERPQNNGPLIAIVASVVGFFVLLSSAAEQQYAIFSVLLVVIAICLVPVFIWGVNRKQKTQRSDAGQRATMWNQRSNEVQRLERLIAKQRSLVD
jgi:ribosomal protein S27AE